MPPGPVTGGLRVRAKRSGDARTKEGDVPIPRIRSHPESTPIRLVEFDKRYNEPPRLVEFGSATVGPAKFPGAKYVFYLVQSEAVVPNRL
jgi:hypothetical protein